MFTVLFEVHPHPAKWETYLSIAKSLRPILEQVPGFIRNIRYRSLQREGWILSLSDWEDEKALVRWRTREKHHLAQEQGREEILADYHLRVGQVVGGGGDDGQETAREDVTKVADGAFVVTVEMHVEEGWLGEKTAEEIAHAVGMSPSTGDLLSWDVFEAVLTPGDVILLGTWRTESAAARYLARLEGGSDKRQGRVARVVRDYGKYDRREAPQYYPDVAGRESLHL